MGPDGELTADVSMVMVGARCRRPGVGSEGDAGRSVPPGPVMAGGLVDGE